MKVTFIIKKAAKRYDTESMATIYVRFRNGRQLDSVAPTQLAINPNLWDVLLRPSNGKWGFKIPAITVFVSLVVRHIEVF